MPSDWRDWVGVYANTANALLIGGVFAYAFSHLGDGGQHFLGRSASSDARNLLWFGVLCGVGAAATIEILKRVLGFRGMYQRRQTEWWLERRSDKKRAFEQLVDALGLDVYEDPRIKRQQLFRLFNLPTEQLSAQIGSATEFALSRRAEYEDLLECLGGTPLPPSDDQEDDQFALAQRVRSGIDQLQISLSEGWRRAVQAASLWIAGWYGVGITRVATFDDHAEASYVLAALVLGGALAWVARDVAALIERARR